mmetsp:Transcript_7019/g.28547  ORF Transcript_7019/g.28547 Transcript_7019/m.28547 type:complete len:224 (-) Transcript_7019:493-1164(-)
MAIQPRPSSSCVVVKTRRGSVCYVLSSREVAQKVKESIQSNRYVSCVSSVVSVILSDFCPRPRGLCVCACCRSRFSARAAQLLISRTRRANSSSKGWLMFISLTMSPISAELIRSKNPSDICFSRLGPRSRMELTKGSAVASAPTSSSCDADLISGPPTRGSTLPTCGSTPPPPPSMSSHSCSGSWMGAAGLGERGPNICDVSASSGSGARGSAGRMSSSSIS